MPDDSAREGLVALLVAALIVAAELWICDASFLFARPLWLDEIHTVLLAGRQSAVTSLKTLAAGADFNPPTLFLLYRGVGKLFGGLSSSTLRMVSLASVVATMPLVFVILRQQFGRVAAAGGALAVWAQSVVVTEAFDARFYGPWLFGAAAISVAVRRVHGDRASWVDKVFLAVASIFVCTIHYFGILSWLGAVGIAAWWGRHASRQTAVRLLPAVAGPIALAMCVPFYIGQRAALSTSTWIPDLSVIGALFLLASAVIVPPVVVALIGWGASRLVQRPPAGDASSNSRPFTLGSALLLAQGLVPVALALFSLAVQPAMQPRYSIAAALAAAPIVAWSCARSTRVFTAMILASILVSSISLVRGAGQAARDQARIVRDDINQVSRIVALDSTVVVRRRHSLYPILIERPDLATRAILLDEASLRPNDKFAMIERDVARVHDRYYGFPRIVTRSGLDTARAFYFLEFDSTRSPTATEFPGRRIQRAGQRLYFLERR